MVLGIISRIPMWANGCEYADKYLQGERRRVSEQVGLPPWFAARIVAAAL